MRNERCGAYETYQDEARMPLYAIDGKQPIVPTSSWLAPSADVIGDARLGEDVSVWFAAAIRADNTAITIGDRTNIQEGAVLHSDSGAPLTIGADCTIGHRVILHGCTIGDRVLIGMGAIVLNNAVIGEGSLVGAGALVTEGKTFPPGSLIVGAPARAVRTLTLEEAAMLTRSAELYANKQRHYAKTLKRAESVTRPGRWEPMQ